MIDPDFKALFKAAKADPDAVGKVAALTRQAIDHISESFHTNPGDSQALLEMTQYLAKKPDQTDITLDAARAAYVFAENDAIADKALAVWSKSFDRLKTEEQKIAALDNVKGNVFIGTSLETAYNKKWDALPDSKTKRDAVKTPAFYEELPAKLAEYGIKNPERSMEEIQPLKYDTRSWSDFVSEAIMMDQLMSGLGAMHAERATPKSLEQEVEDHEASFQKLMARAEKEGIFGKADASSPQDKQQADDQEVRLQRLLGRMRDKGVFDEPAAAAPVEQGEAATAWGKREKAKKANPPSSKGK